MTFVFVPVLRVLIVHRLVVNHQKVLRLAILDILGEIEASRDDRVVINDRNLVVGDGMLSVDQGADSRMGQRRGFRVGSNRFDVDLSERTGNQAHRSPAELPCQTRQRARLRRQPIPLGGRWPRLQMPHAVLQCFVAMLRLNLSGFRQRRANAKNDGNQGDCWVSGLQQTRANTG